MKSATIPNVYTYRRYASNGGTSIYHSQDKISEFDDQLKFTPDLKRSRTKKKPVLWMNQIDNASFNSTTEIYPTSSTRWFFGNKRRKKDHIVFEFREGREYLKIYLFKKFKPASPKLFTEKFIRQ